MLSNQMWWLFCDIVKLKAILIVDTRLNFYANLHFFSTFCWSNNEFVQSHSYVFSSVLGSHLASSVKSEPKPSIFHSFSFSWFSKFLVWPIAKTFCITSWRLPIIQVPITLRSNTLKLESLATIGGQGRFLNKCSYLIKRRWNMKY